jgi:hypothetical protein
VPVLDDHWSAGDPGEVVRHVEEGARAAVERGVGRSPVTPVEFGDRPAQSEVYLVPGQAGAEAEHGGTDRYPAAIRLSSVDVSARSTTAAAPDRSGQAVRAITGSRCWRSPAAWRTPSSVDPPLVRQQDLRKCCEVRSTR